MAQTGTRSLGRYLALGGLSSVLVLAINFGTGVLVARQLGDDGRGKLAVLLTLTQIVGWLAALGMTEGLVFLAATRPALITRIIGTSFRLILVLGTAGVVIAELLLPLVLHGDTESALGPGRWFMLSVLANVGLALLLASLRGSQDFGAATLIQFLQPFLYLVGLLAVYAAGSLTLEAVLAATAASTVAAAVVALVRLLTVHGVGSFSMPIARAAVTYGVKVQAALFASLANARLDILVLPAVLSAAAIGDYSVATNTSSVLVGLIGSAGSLVLPAAARRGGADGVRLVSRLLRLSFYGGLATAIPMFVLAPWLIDKVYGSTFDGAADPLRLLLPGVVFAIGTVVLEGGLQAAGRPIAASVGQVCGFVVTGLGLLLTLRPYGINGAAGTTTAAYATAFAVVLFLMAQEEHFSYREAFSITGFWRELSGAVGSRLPRRGQPA